MTPPVADIAALHCQLGAEIARALQTSEHAGATLVSCYLQMALDMLGESGTVEAARARHDSTGGLQGL